MKRNLTFLFCSILLILSITACVDMATTSAQAVYNRHSLQKNFKDQYITMQAFQALHYKTKAFEDANISVATFNGNVLLAGQVNTPSQKQQAEAIVKQIDGVQELHNLLTIEAPSSSLTRISDAWITAKIKSKLIASEEVEASDIKVVTENGTVYLMGIVPPESAEAAIELARTTDGVQSVVKIFSYIHINKDQTL